MELFKKGKTGIIAKLHGTDLVICSHSREWKTPSYGQINTVNGLHIMCDALLYNPLYYYEKYRIMHLWLFYSKFMKQAFIEFHNFHMK